VTDRAALVHAFEAFPSRLAASARAAAAAGSPVPPGEWGPNAVVRHLIAVERVVWRARLTSIRDEDEPLWSWTEPGPEPGLEDAPLEDLLARFAETRTATLALLGSIDAATWARTGVHATYGPLDVAALLRIATEHDAEHLLGLEHDKDAG
jgi:hypothetical protein